MRSVVDPQGEKGQIASSVRPLVALSSYASAQTPQWKSATGELAAKAVRGVAPQLDAGDHVGII